MIEEGNRLIEQFVGVDSLPYKSLDAVNYPFHTSWDWLMPVVEKLESLGMEVNINGLECHIHPPDLRGKLIVHCKNWSSKIETVWQSVVEAVKWINEKNEAS